MGVEVSMAGSFAGTPVILTQTVQLSPRKKVIGPGGLDSIPEVEEALVQAQENGVLNHRTSPESVQNHLSCLVRCMQGRQLHMVPLAYATRWWFQYRSSEILVAFDGPCQISEYKEFNSNLYNS